MQEVYKDGSGGEIKTLEQMKELTKSVLKPDVHHVEVFNLGSAAHKKAVMRIKDLNISRREKKRFLNKIRDNK